MSRFSEWSPGQALGVLALTLSVTVLLAAIALTRETLPSPRGELPDEYPAASHVPIAVFGASTMGVGATPDGTGSFCASAALLSAKRETDWVFYRNVVERVRAGENYYDAVWNELRKPKLMERGFAPTSVFNWRTPIYAWIFGWLPGPGWGQLLLCALAIVCSLLAFVVVGRQLSLSMLPLTLFLIGPFGWCLTGEVYYFTELWAGLLIALSILCAAMASPPPLVPPEPTMELLPMRARKAPPSGAFRVVSVLAGIAALFFRELALPYCLLALVLALLGRRWKEVLGWTAGLACYTAFYAYHIIQVHSRIAGLEDGGSLQLGQWVRFGGAVFIIGTTELSNILLITMPAWVTAIYLPLALLGLAGWRGETGARIALTAAGYLLFFAIAGQPFNAYWGLLIAPLLTLGIVAMPLAILDLFRAARD